jgi:hypothetical protein
MKNLKLILLLQALILGALTLNAEDCPCEGGTAEYTVDCDGDGTNDACSTDDCDPCTTANPDPETAGYECCGGEEFDPDYEWGSTLSQINFSELVTIWNSTKDTLNTISPCDTSGSPIPSGSLTVSFTNDCCDDSVTDLRKFAGNVSWDAGSISCDWPFVGIPYVASANVTVNGGFGVTINANDTEDCDGNELCFDGNPDFTIGGGISATAGFGVIRVSCTLQTGASVNVTYCVDSGFDSPSACIGQIKVVGTASFLSAADKAIEYVIYSGNC